MEWMKNGLNESTLFVAVCSCDDELFGAPTVWHLIFVESFYLHAPTITRTVAQYLSHCFLPFYCLCNRNGCSVL